MVSGHVMLTDVCGVYSRDAAVNTRDDVLFCVLLTASDERATKVWGAKFQFSDIQNRPTAAYFRRKKSWMLKILISPLNSPKMGTVFYFWN